MIGHVVLCHGRNENDEVAFAVWRVNTAGESVGAWIVPCDLAIPDPESARIILQLCLRRAVTAWDPADVLSILATLEKTAGVAPLPWNESAIALPELLSEIDLARVTFEKRTTAERQAKKHRSHRMASGGTRTPTVHSRRIPAAHPADDPHGKSCQTRSPAGEQPRTLDGTTLAGEHDSSPAPAISAKRSW